MRKWIPIEKAADEFSKHDGEPAGAWVVKILRTAEELFWSECSEDAGFSQEAFCDRLDGVKLAPYPIKGVEAYLTTTEGGQRAISGFVRADNAAQSSCTIPYEDFLVRVSWLEDFCRIEALPAPSAARLEGNA